MKKIIALVLSFAFVMSYSVLLAEEEFSIHSGVKFGMSVSEVEAAERANGFSPESTNLEVLMGFNPYPNAGPITTSVNGTIAGIADSRIIFDYHDDKLFRAEYKLGGNTRSAWDTFQMDKERMEIDYEAISDSLTNKYGNTDYTWLTSKKFDLPGEYYDIVVSCFGQQEWCIANPIMESTVNIERYEQWLIPQSDGSAILIDHSLYFYNTEFSHHIYYTHFAADIIQESNKQAEQRNNDL